MRHNLLKDLAEAKKSRKNATAADGSTDYRKGKLLGAQSSFAASEAYKATRTNLLFTRVGDGCQVVACTSTFPGEGKTINCCNLAISVSQNDRKVLIIDADMRRPMVAKIFGIANQVGLSEILAGIHDTKRQSIPLVQTEYPNVSVIPSGHIPPNPAELLASDRLQMLLDLASQQFDYIFIDTPPVSVVTDASVLAKNVDGYVLVVRAGMTPIEDLRNVVLKMEQVEANILGFILNDLDAKSGSYKYSYRSEKKYGYGGYDETKPSERLTAVSQQGGQKR